MDLSKIFLKGACPTKMGGQAVMEDVYKRQHQVFEYPELSNLFRRPNTLSALCIFLRQVHPDSYRVQLSLIHIFW